MIQTLQNVIAALLLLLCVTPTPAQAWWYTNNVPEGADILIDEVRWPKWPEPTYFAMYNSHPYPKGGYFYGGFAPRTTGDSTDIEMVWTFWGSAAYNGQRAKPVSMGEHLYGGPMFGEGASCGFTGRFNFMKTMQWYRIVKRIWPDPDAPDVSYIGWWMKDLANDRWHESGVVKLPIKATGFRGQSCFIEVIGPPDLRQLDRRHNYHRLDGQWRPTDQIIQRENFAKTCTWQSIEDGRVWRFSSTPHTPEHAPKVLPGKPNLRYVTFENMPPLPRLSPPRVTSVTALRAGNDVVVSWTVPADAPPQLGYTVTLLDENGRAVAEQSAAQPTTKIMRLSAQVPVTTVRVTVRDIYDQTVSAESSVREAKSEPAYPSSDTRDGVQYFFYEAPTSTTWQRLPDFEKLNATRQGIARGLDNSLLPAQDNAYGVIFRGLINVPATGAYVFELQSSDGSRLTIGDRVVVDNDGIHSRIAKGGSAFLEKGLHPFELAYFDAPGPHGAARLEYKLRLAWEGPGFSMQQVPNDVLKRSSDAAQLDLELRITKHEHNMVTIAPVKGPHDHRIEKIEVFSGSIRLGVISENGKKASEQSDCLDLPLPQGENQIWVRFWLDSSKLSVDTAVTPVQGNVPADDHWSIEQLGEQWPAGVSVSPQRVTILGEGDVFATRTLTGDFTITARLGEVREATKQNGIHPAARIGLVASGNHVFGLWRTAGKQMRGAPSDRDLETSGYSRWPVSENVPWVRLTRRGTHLRAYVSQDGHDWKLVIDRVYKKLNETMNVGISLHSLPHYSKTVFSGAVEQIQINQPGPNMTDSPPPAPVVGRDLFIGRVVKLISDQQDHPRTYARTYGNGVHVSTDAGTTWNPLNLPPQAKWVRSIAIHPKDPDVLLVAAGHVNESKKVVSTLWRTGDAGKSWQKVSEAIDFRGDLATVLCGEVISFDPDDPDTVFAGGEGAGLFASTDAGLTWKPHSLKGQHISFVTHSPRYKHFMLVGTAASGSWGLDRGNTPGRIYSNNDPEAKMSLEFELPGIGMNDLAFETIHEGDRYFYFATTHGVYYTDGLETFFQYRYNIEPHANYIALTSYLDQSARNRVVAVPWSASGSTALFHGQIGYYWSLVWGAQTLDPALRSITGILHVHGNDPSSVKMLICNNRGIWQLDGLQNPAKQVFAIKNN